MGQKVNPKVLRLGYTTTWSSRWFSLKRLPEYLREDGLIRVFLKKELREAGVAQIQIERALGGLTIIIYSAKPGVIIGRQGAGIEELKKKIIKKFYRGRKVKLNVNVEEVAKPAVNAAIVAEQIIADIEKRLPFRRVMKMAIERGLKAGALGVKIRLSGRLNGAEIARRETLSQGKIPLHTLRADIDFCSDFARTLMGTIGVKVWIYRGDIFQNAENNNTRMDLVIPRPAARETSRNQSVSRLRAPAAENRP